MATAIRVLYVDDEPDLLEIAKIFIEESGEFQVSTSISAQEALASQKIQTYDAIIADYQMPGVDGIEFLKIVRERFGDIPFILFTGRGREEVVIQAINNGADFYLQKGGDPQAQFAELEHKIRQSVRRKRAERSFQDLERRFADIIDFLPDATFAIDSAGVVIAWNRAIEEMTGIPATDMLGKGNYEYAIPFYGSRRPILIDLIDQNEEEIRQWYSNIFRTPTSLTAETDLPHPKGHQISVLVKVSHLYNQEGDITGTIESIRDITERKHLEMDLGKKHQELQASYEQLAAIEEELRAQYKEMAEREGQIRANEERLTMAQEIGHNGSWEYNILTKTLWGTAETNRIFGFPARVGEVSLAEVDACIVEREQIMEALSALVNEEKDFNLEFVINPADGSAPRTLHSVARLEKDRGGRPLRVMGVIQDITERKKAEAAFQKISTELQLIFKHMINAFIVWESVFDENGRYVSFRFGYFNDAYARIAKVEYENVRGKDVFEVWPTTEQSWVEVYGSVATTGIPKIFDMYHDPTRGWYHCNVYRPTDSPSQVCAIIEDITERRRVEEEIAFQNAILSTQQETSLDAILIVDADGKILHYNQQFLQIWGIPEDLAAQRIDEPVLRFVTDQLADPDAFLSRVQYLYAHREEKSFEELTLKDGRVLERFSSPMLGESGKYYGRIWYFRDITDRKRAETSLKKSESFLTSVIEQSPNPMWISDRDGNLIKINPACKDLLHLSDEDLVGKYNVFHDNIVEEQGFMPLIRRVFDQGEIVRFPLVYDSATLKGLPLPQTVKRTLAVTVFPIRDPDGNVTNAVIQPQDVTEWKQTEEALRESESRYRELADLLPQMVFELDSDFRVTYANQHTLSVFGFTVNDIETGISGLSFIDPSQHERVRENARELREGRSVDKPEEYTAVKADGSRFPALVYSSPIIRNNSLAGFRGIILDITASKNLEEELRESERTFRTIFECSPYPIAINSLPKNQFLEVNQAFLDASGYSEVEIIGKTPIELGMISFTDGARLIAHRVAAGKIENVPLALNVKEGRMIHVLFSTMPVTLESGPAVVTIVVEITNLKRIERELLQKNEELNAAYKELTAGDEKLRQNIDELSKTELELRQSEEKFRSLIEHSLDGIVIVDFSGNILFLNREAGKIVDETEYRTLIGKKNVMDYVDPVSHADVKRDLNRVAGGDEAHLVSYRVRTGSGSEIWVECVGSRIIFGETEAVLISMRDVTERKVAEDAVRESENRFITLFQRSPVSLTLVSAIDGRFTDVNEEFLRKTGFSHDDVIGRRAEELGLFADPEEYRHFVTALREQRTVHGMELKCRAKSGEINTCRFSSGIIEMAGKPYILSTVEDITEWKLAEYAIEAMVRSMVGTTGVGALWKIAENINSWLGADCVMVGEIQPDGSTVKVVSMLLDGEEVSDYSYTLEGTPCEDVTEKGFCLYSDNVIGMFPGSKDLVALNIRGYAGTPLRDSRGEVIGILCVLSRTPLYYTHTIREIMEVIAAKAAVEIERIRIERDLLESRQMLAEAMDLARLVNWEYDVASGMFTFNDRFYAIYDTTKEREGGSRMSAETYAREFIPPEERDAVAKEVMKALETTDPDYTSQLEHRIIRRDGEIRHIVVHIGITKDKEGKTIKTHGANQDITDLKRAEESLRLANRQLSILSGITRHDILNKTSVILGFLAIAKKKWKDPPLLDLLRKTESATRTIQSQIEFTRTYQNLGVQAPQWLELDSIIPCMQVPAGIAMVTDVQGISLLADPMLEMVFANLLDNSIRHGEHVSEIRVCANRSEDHLVLVWEDNGIGVADNEKERIFDRGFGKNTGLGMFLAREILALTGITIRETGIRGQGARFEITIPKGQYRCQPLTRTTW